MNNAGNGEEGAIPPDQPEARNLLKGAYETTYRWEKGFKGFSSDLEVILNGKSYKGRAEVQLPDQVKVLLSDMEAGKWAEGQIGMMAVHRAYRLFDAGDGKHSLSLGEFDLHPLGQLVRIHGDGLNTRYRIKENRILQINRNMGPVRFTINIQDSIKTSDGKYLNTRYVVYYFTPKGDLKQVESFNDDPKCVDEIYLPGRRRIFLSDGGEVSVKELLFSNHQLY
ncbi:MAG: DUF3386 family protein [Nitrospirae bacterium]|nr:DUF3386 family protein [Nitrospirota bacterium]MBI3594739.1 DUF3386 family protein [Nitrospirota bacterium]